MDSTTLKRLELGLPLTLFVVKKKPEKRTFALKVETRQLVWSAPGKSQYYEGIVDLADVQYVRVDKTSKEFERWSDEIQRIDRARCFVVLYGREFNLRTISCVAQSVAEAELWCRALTELGPETVHAPLYTRTERWLRKEFHYQMGNRAIIGVPELKAFLARMHLKISLQTLNTYFSALDSRFDGNLGFDAFSSLYYQLVFCDRIFQDYLLQDYFASTTPVGTKHFADEDSDRDSSLMSVVQFQCFLHELQYNSAISDEQAPAWIDDANECRQRVLAFLNNIPQPLRRAALPSSNAVNNELSGVCFSKSEFLNYLFSESNSVWDYEVGDRVYQDMDHPLTHYWISSSHNTYLTGNALTSESSVEAYVRCLRQGCRCVELDTWDGPDGLPIIYHGHTLTTKIKFIDVLYAIRDNAFIASEFPVILSIEDHCCLTQQRAMAKAFRDVLGDLLLTQPVGDKDVCAMPSPNQLKRKILIKHKRLPDGMSAAAAVAAVDANNKEAFQWRVDNMQAAGGDAAAPECFPDMSSSLKGGVMYLEDKIINAWIPHYFVLTYDKIYYIQKPGEDDLEDLDATVADDGDGSKASGDNSPTKQQPAGSENRSVELSAAIYERLNIPRAEWHAREPWYYPGCGRERSEQLLAEHADMGDGTFLVRPSEAFVGDYTLSFLRRGSPNHVRIRSRTENGGNPGGNKYFIMDKTSFDSVYDLIQYYRKNKLHSKEFAVFLDQSVPQALSFMEEPWYHDFMSRLEAEAIIGQVVCDGAFLVRRSERSEQGFVISFRTQSRCKHVRVERQGRFFTIGASERFSSLTEGVEHYKKAPLFSGVRLKYPITKDTIERLNAVRRIQHAHTAAAAANGAAARSARTIFTMGNNTNANPSSNLLNVPEKQKSCGNLLTPKTMPQKGSLQQHSAAPAVSEELLELTPSANNQTTRQQASGVVRHKSQHHRTADRHTSSAKLHSSLKSSSRPSVAVDIASDAAPLLQSFDLQPRILCLTLFDYTGRRADELTFCKDAIINNVTKHDFGWFQGDCNGRVQAWFPASHVEEIDINPVTASSAVTTTTIAADGGLLQPSKTETLSISHVNEPSSPNFLDLYGCTVQESPAAVPWPGRKKPLYLLTLSPTNHFPVDFACESEKSRDEWAEAIREALRVAADHCRLQKKNERQYNCARELSNLIVYCRTAPFVDDVGAGGGDFRSMASFSETKVEKLISREKCLWSIRHHRQQFSRVYPKGKRVDSSNYDPMRMWLCGFQMVALNFQTPDPPMQINQARFMTNGRCGYVLMPEYMLNDSSGDTTAKIMPYNPYEWNSVPVAPLLLNITVIAGRHLGRAAHPSMQSGPVAGGGNAGGAGGGACGAAGVSNNAGVGATGPSGGGNASKVLLNPFVEVEVLGAEYDNNKFKSGVVEENGFNPIWNEQCEFDVHNPDVALLRFVVFDQDSFGDATFVGQATYPVRGLRSGFRSVPLKNSFSEPLELAALLVYVEMRSLDYDATDEREDLDEVDENIYDVNQQQYAHMEAIRAHTRQLSSQIEADERAGNSQASRSGQKELENLHKKLTELKEQRKEARNKRRRMQQQQRCGGGGGKRVLLPTKAGATNNAAVESSLHPLLQHQSMSSSAATTLAAAINTESINGISPNAAMKNLIMNKKPSLFRMLSLSTANASTSLSSAFRPS